MILPVVPSGADGEEGGVVVGGGCCIVVVVGGGGVLLPVWKSSIRFYNK